MSYSSQSLSGYNTSPPSDDGTASASNQVAWDTVKTKLSDPLKTQAEAINSNLVAQLGGTYAPLTKTVDTNTGATDTVTGADAYSVQVYSYASANVAITISNSTAWTAGDEITFINTGGSHNLVFTGSGITLNSYTGHNYSGGDQYEVVRATFTSNSAAVLWGNIG